MTMTFASSLQGADARALARPLLPGSVALSSTDPGRPQPAALPEERAALSRARPARLREFDAGRAAARAAMAALGLPPAPVLHGADRAPVWPEGLTGSIAHCATACLAAVARQHDIRALGLDLEENNPLPDDLIETVCTPVERSHLAALPRSERGALAKRIFCAKEASYKAQYPLSRTLFDFHTLQIGFDDAPGAFTARFLRAVPPFDAGTVLRGRLATGNGLIVAAVVLPACSQPPFALDRP